MKSVPNKFKLVVHYIIANCGDPRKLGATKLNKILWFADVTAYRHWRESITGSKYLRRKMGPVPAKILHVSKQLETEKKIYIKNRKYMYDPVIYTSLEDPDVSTLSKREIGLLDSLINLICNDFSAIEISHISHDDIWKAAADGEEIPLTAMLVSDSGNYRREVQLWANGVIANHE